MADDEDQDKKLKEELPKSIKASLLRRMRRKLKSR